MDRETDCARRSYDPRCTPDGMDGLYVDCTFGRGGHSRHILQQLSSKGRLMAFDVDRAVLLPRSRLAVAWQDPEAVAFGKKLEQEEPSKHLKDFTARMHVS